MLHCSSYPNQAPLAVRALFTVTLIILVALSIAPDSRAQEIEGQRLAQTGMKFLSVPIDARSAAMSNAVIAGEGSSMSLFYNPAGMVGLDAIADVSLGTFQWIGDIRYNAGSAAFRPFDGRYGVLGITVERVDYGEVREVIRANNNDGYLKLGTVNPGASAVGLGYARQVTDRFSVGGHIKYAQLSLGGSVMRIDDSGNPFRSNNQRGTVAFDLGILYKTGFRSLNFAMSARNFSREVTYAEESFELPLMLRIGLAMDMIDLTQIDPATHSVLLSVEGQRPRDYPEQIKAGVEYTFMESLALRAGYAFPHDERGISVGAGLNQELGGLHLSADYAYSEFGVFGEVNRISVGISL